MSIEGVERLPSGDIKYRGEIFPGYNKPKTAPAGSDKKKRVLAKKGDEVKIVNFGQRGYKHNYSPEAKKNYLARSAGIKGKDDKFSANYWSRRVLWPSNQEADGSAKTSAEIPGARPAGDMVLRKYMTKYKNDPAGFNSRQTKLDMRNELERAYAPIMSKSQLESWRREYNSHNKLAAALYRPRGTIFVTDGKGNVLAGKRGVDSPIGYGATSPYYFPGGGILEEGATHTPSKKEILDSVRRESLEELGFKINRLKLLRDEGLRLDMPDWWVNRQFRKRGVEYKGLDEYYVHAREGAQDKSIHGSEGDAFTGRYYPIEKVVSALEDYADNGDSSFGDANRLQAQLLSKLSEDKVYTVGFANNMDDSFSKLRTAMRSRFPDKSPEDVDKLLRALKSAAKELQPKKDDHPTQRLKERTNLDPEIIGKLRQAIKKNQDRIPPGDHHVELDDGSRAVIKELRRRHVLATILASNMNRYPGQNLQYLYNTKTAGFLSGAGKALRFGANPAYQSAIGAGSYALGSKIDQDGNSGRGFGKALKGIGVAGMGLGGARLGMRGLSTANKALGNRMGSVADAAYPRMQGQGRFANFFNKFHSNVDKVGRGGALHNSNDIFSRFSAKASNRIASTISGSPIKDVNARRALVGGGPTATMGSSSGGVAGTRTFIRGVQNTAAPILNSRVGMGAAQAASAYGLYNADSNWGRTTAALGLAAFNPLVRRGLIGGGRQLLSNMGSAGRLGKATNFAGSFGSHINAAGAQVGKAVADPNSAQGVFARSVPRVIAPVGRAVMDPNSAGGFLLRNSRNLAKGAVGATSLYGGYRVARN